VYVADSFSGLQMYVVFEFEDSGHDLESVQVSSSLCSCLVLIALLFLTLLYSASLSLYQFTLF